MGTFYSVMIVSVIVIPAILAGMLIFMCMKGDDFDDFAH